MNFPSKLDETVGLLAKNTRFSDIDKGTLLLHSMAVHDEYCDEERKYGEAVAAGWLNKGGIVLNDGLSDFYHQLSEAGIVHEETVQEERFRRFLEAQHV